MSGLDTDLYELRMAASYLRHGMRAPATFSLFVRDLPAERGFLVAAGLDEALRLLEEFRFTDDEIGYLRDVVRLGGADLEAMARLRFTGDVWAVPEGHAVFAREPLLEVTAPIAEAQLVETVLLNAVTYRTALATKATRCRLAAAGADLVDFSYRRTHGLEAADAVARACAVAGFTATSNVTAARRYGLRPSGTMAHSYVQAFPDERAAFTAFATDFPGEAVFLVDTYDTLDGVRTAIDVIDELGITAPVGIRLDSGDLASLAKQARRLLDRAGLTHARIIASGGLDEYAVARLVAQGAPIDAYGVGTKVGVSADAPSLDSAYKLVAYDRRPVMKLSEGKASDPGAKQIYRRADADLLALRDEPPQPDAEPLLVEVMRDGARTAAAGPATDIAASRHRLDADLAWLPANSRKLTGAGQIPVMDTTPLRELRRQLASRLAAAREPARAG